MYKEVTSLLRITLFLLATHSYVRTIIIALNSTVLLSVPALLAVVHLNRVLAVTHTISSFYRDTIKGKKYSIWKLSDLSSQTAVLSLFLFGSAFQDHWKTSVGTVIAILNPNIMPDKEVREMIEK